MVRRIRRWLNVKTWGQTHVPLPLDTEEEKLRALFDINRPMLNDEDAIDFSKTNLCIEAMTFFLQLGLPDNLQNLWRYGDRGRSLSASRSPADQARCRSRCRPLCQGCCQGGC